MFRFSYWEEGQVVQIIPQLLLLLSFGLKKEPTEWDFFINVVL